MPQAASQRAASAQFSQKAVSHVMPIANIAAQVTPSPNSRSVASWHGMLGAAVGT
jgi:hypothetical protein